MKAARIVPGPERGHIEVMDIPLPPPGPGQVLVRVRAAGLNRGEIKQVVNARGSQHLPIGVEFAGEVAEVGSHVHAWRKGDRVMGHGNGGQAEYVLAAPDALIRVPNDLSWVEAAAFPNVFITAHDALITNARLQSGETVLVNAAASGVALAAFRIAQAMGASRVIGSTRSSEKAQRLRELGMEAIDLSREDQVDRVRELTEGRGVDVIIDAVGGTVLEANLQSLAIKGRLVNIARMGAARADFDMEALWLKRLQLIGATFRTRSEAERLACVQACARDLLPHLEAGRLALPVDRCFRLDQLAEAHAYMLTDRHFGKIVLAVDDTLMS